MPSEKYAARRGSVEDGMRMITACFARAPQRCTSRTYRHFLLVFHEVRSISKTCNQLTISLWIQLWIIAIARNASQQAARRSHGIVNFMQKTARLYGKERTTYGFMPSRTPVFSPLTHPHIASRERRLVAIFNKLTMPVASSTT